MHFTHHRTLVSLIGQALDSKMLEFSRHPLHIFRGVKKISLSVIFILYNPTQLVKFE
jgi:hypothetical protein